ncbi:MAG: PAS domain S-box protein, partial [Mariprofundaceae bacterium]|nr:PAS domain S-box protein [Mariprofundaceae bacterium]
SVNHWLEDGDAIPNGELTLCDKKGAPIHVYSSHIMTEDAHGNKEMFCIDIDMGPQQEMFSALQKSNAQLLALINTSPDLIFLKDENGVYLSCNQRFAELYGTSEENIIGKTDYDFVDKSLADFFHKKDKIAIELGHASTNEEKLFFASDNHHEVVETIKTPIYDSKGDLTGVLGVARDITERKRSELFKEQTTKIITMIATGEASPKIYDAIALTYESRHPGMRCSILELKANRLMHTGAPSLPQEYCDAMNGLKNGPSVGSCGASTFTGKRVLVEDIATDPKWAEIKDFALPHGLRCCWSEPIKSPSDKILGAIAMYYDYPALPNEEESNDLESAAILAGIVMERERQQDSLRKLSQAIEQAGESILITDTKGIIEYVNPMFTKMTGYESDEVLGENPRILKSGNQDEQYYKDLWATITSGKVWQSTVIDRRKDGSQYPAVMSISPIFDDHENITH